MTEDRYIVDPFDCDCGTLVDTNKKNKDQDFMNCPNPECKLSWVITV